MSNIWDQFRKFLFVFNFFIEAIYTPLMLESSNLPKAIRIQRIWCIRLALTLSQSGHPYRAYDHTRLVICSHPSGFPNSYLSHMEREKREALSAAISLSCSPCYQRIRKWADSTLPIINLLNFRNQQYQKSWSKGVEFLRFSS